MDKRNHEQIIYVKDLLFAALYRWRIILVAALVAAILFGGVAILVNLPSTSNETSVEATPISTPETEALKLEIAQLQADIENRTIYLENSILMNLDSTELYCFSIDLFINPAPSDTEEINPYNYVYSYQSALQSTALTEQIATKLNTSTLYVSELLTIAIPAQTDRIITLSFRSGDADITSAVKDLICSYITQTSTMLKTSIGNHEIVVNVGNVFANSDPALKKSQTSLTSELTKWQIDLETKQQQLNTMSTPPVVTNTQVSMKKVAVIGAILGIVFGCFAVAGCAWVAHLAGSTVYSARTFQNRTGLRVLGCIPTTDKLNPIDRLLKKAEGRILATRTQFPPQLSRSTITEIPASLLTPHCPLILSSLSPLHWSRQALKSFVSEISSLTLMPYPISRIAILSFL